MAKQLYQHCCRLCLYTGADVGLVDVFSIPKLTSLVLELYNIEVTPNDGSTTRVCSVCLKDTLDFNAKIKQYDQEKKRIQENNAKILQKLQAATPTTSGQVTKAATDLASKEKRPSNEFMKPSNKDAVSRNEKGSNERPQAAQHQQQVTTETPRQTPSKSSDSRMLSAENRASDSREASNDKVSKGSDAKDSNKDGSRGSSHVPSEQSAAKSKGSAKAVDSGSARKEKQPPSEFKNSNSGSRQSTTSNAKNNDPRRRPSSPKPTDKSGFARSENRSSESRNSNRGSKESTTNARPSDPRRRPSSPKPTEKFGLARSENRSSESRNYNRGSKESTTNARPSDPRRRPSPSRSIDKPGLARSENRPSEPRTYSRGSKESTTIHAKNNDPRRRPSSPKSIDKSGLARSGNRTWESENSRRGSSGSSTSVDRHNDPRRRPSPPRSLDSGSRSISSGRAHDGIRSGENRASNSGDSTSKSKDSLKRPNEGRESSKIKTADQSRSESSGKGGSSKSAENPPDKKRFSNDSDYGRSSDSISRNKKSNNSNDTTPIKSVVSSTNESSSSKDSASSQSQSNNADRGSDKPRQPEQSTARQSNNADVQTPNDGPSKDKRDMAPENSVQRESAAEPSTSGINERPAEGTSGILRQKTPELDCNTVNRKRTAGEPLKLPRLKIRILKPLQAPEAEVHIVPSNATTAYHTATTVSVTTTNSTLCTAATTTTTTTEPISLPVSQTQAMGPAVPIRVAELQASKPGIPMRRHSTHQTSLIRVSNNLFDSSKESDEFAAIRNNTMLRLDALRGSGINDVNARPAAAAVAQGIPQIPTSNAGSGRAPAVGSVILNRAAGTSTSQPQTSMTDADILSSAVQKPGMKRRKSICVANVRQMLINEQLQTMSVNRPVRIYPVTAIPAGNLAAGRYNSSHNAAPAQSATRNTAPTMRTSANYTSNTVRYGNTTIAPASLNAQSTWTGGRPVPPLRVSMGQNGIPVHILNRNAANATSDGSVRYNLIQPESMRENLDWEISYGDGVRVSIPRPSIAGESQRNISSMEPRAPHITLLSQRPPMPVFEHAYSIN